MNTKTTRSVTLLAVVTLCAFCFASNADMLYYMPFDDGANPTLANYGTVGGTSTLAGTTVPYPSTNSVMGSHSENMPLFNSGYQGGAVVLPDSTDRLELTSTDDEISFATWLRWNGNTSLWAKGVVNKGGNEGWALIIENSSRVSWNVYRTDGNGVSSKNSDVNIPSDGNWTHLGFTFSPGSGWATQFYVNGERYQGGWTGQGVGIANDQPIRLGCWDLGYWGGLNGLLDETAFWDERLSSAKMSGIYNLATDVGMTVGMANSLFELYDAAGADDGFLDGSGWYAWYDDGAAIGDLGTVTDLGMLSSYDGYAYPLAPTAHYYYLNLGSGVVFAIPEPASIALLGLASLVLLRHRNRLLRCDNRMGSQ